MTSKIGKQDVSLWIRDIAEKRRAVATTVTDFKYAKCRVRQLKGPNHFPALDENFEEKIHEAILTSDIKMGVLYWMIRDQRVQDNWAFLFAQRLALKFKVPLHVCFCFVPKYQAETLRHYTFMIEGLKEVEKECRELCIPFHITSATSIPDNKLIKTGIKRKLSESINDYYADKVAQSILSVIQSANISCIITDFSPLREPSSWIKGLSEVLPENIPFCQVDAHNIVPVWHASDHLEYAARTIRPSLHQKANTLMTEFPPLIKHPCYHQYDLPPIDWDYWMSEFSGDISVKPVDWIIPGTNSGLTTLHKFIHERLSKYADCRNDPTKNCLSDLSPWFHYGQVAPQRALIEVKLWRHKYKDSVDAFVEEAFIRRELSDNFCYYNPKYDSMEGAWKWAQDTLTQHAHDKRNPSYSEETMVSADTKDDLWNAAQRQLVRTGKLHGFLRMYWAKKILEWHEDGPSAALKLAFYLNDHFALDGSDPNGFVGVMWSICGVHDQGWAERPVFGKIRCMTYKGCLRKFSVPTFVARYPK
uniref:Deoxyribodipyrimidine photo-lyase n=2 Tax=Schistosoma japonicum TaxID=6182 RepID=C1LEH0_SCHJA|nr:photorepair [Schistosoma japonicum]